MLFLHTVVSFFVDIDLVCNSPTYDDDSVGLASILFCDEELIMFELLELLVMASRMDVALCSSVECFLDEITVVIAVISLGNTGDWVWSMRIFEEVTLVWTVGVLCWSIDCSTDAVVVGVTVDSLGMIVEWVGSISFVELIASKSIVERCCSLSNVEEVGSISIFEEVMVSLDEALGWLGSISIVEEEESCCLFIIVDDDRMIDVEEDFTDVKIWLLLKWTEIVVVVVGGGAKVDVIVVDSDSDCWSIILVAVIALFGAEDVSKMWLDVSKIWVDVIKMFGKEVVMMTDDELDLK